MDKNKGFTISLSGEKTSSDRTGRFLLFAAAGSLLLISLSYFLWFGNGLFFYQENNSLFIFSGEYLGKYIAIPGGLLEYTGNFISQGYFNVIYGSLVLSFLLSLFFAVIFRIYKLLSADKPIYILLILVPACLLFLVQSGIDRRMHHTLGYLFLLLYFQISIIFDKKQLNILIPALYPLFFYITGSFALIFPLVFLCYSVVNKKGRSRYPLPGILIITSIVTYIIFENILFLLPPGGLMKYPLPLSDMLTNLHAGDIILCCYIILFPLIVRISRVHKLNGSYSLLLSVVSILAVVVITLLLLKNRFDPEFEKYIKFEKLFFKQQYDKIICLHEQDPSRSMIGQYYYNLALSEKGQLCERIFYGDQDFGVRSLVLPREPEYINRSLYFYYTVGLVNEAHHIAYESMVKYGYRPDNLKMLTKTEIINGNYKSAKRYLGVMKKTLHYRKWADRYIAMLDDPSLILSDSELGGKIRLLPRIDFFISQDDMANIDFMLLANPRNKIAFEYKMAWFLLEKDYKAVVYQVKRMRDMNYYKLPEHIAEAILLFIHHKHELPYLGDFTVNIETANRFGLFLNILDNTSDQKVPEIIKNTPLQNTFWFYYEFK